MFRLSLSAFLLSSLFWPTLFAADDGLAIIDAGVEGSEDAPFVTADYRFQPGDYIYTIFGVAGFQSAAGGEGQPRKIALSYQITPEDGSGVALAASVTDKVEVELNAEDKHWTPKRRASFLLPSLVAAGTFQIRIVVNDLVAKTETSKTIPFRMGGVTVAAPGSLSVQDFQFFRRETDRQPVEVPAFAAGDNVFVRFLITGFKVEEKNTYHVAYELLVTRPDGKPFLNRPDAAELTSDSFYPAKYLPGEFNLTTSRDSPKGTYIIVAKVNDKIGNASKEVRFPFTIE